MFRDMYNLYRYDSFLLKLETQASFILKIVNFCLHYQNYQNSWRQKVPRIGFNEHSLTFKST